MVPPGWSFYASTKCRCADQPIADRRFADCQSAVANGYPNICGADCGADAHEVGVDDLVELLAAAARCRIHQREQARRRPSTHATKRGKETAG